MLNEQKQAIINQYVTGKIDASTGKPYPRCKPSGVEWLGEIPEHWEVRRLKSICLFAYGDSLPDSYRTDGAIPVYGSNGKVGTHSNANTKGPCIIIGRKGSFGKVNYSQIPVFAIDTTYFIDNRFTKSNLRWLYYILVFSKLDSVTKDSAVPGLDRNEAYSCIVPYCKSNEQQLIAEKIDSEIAKLKNSINHLHRQISLLREYRTRLIADVVTGKVDVREIAAKLPEEPAEEFEEDTTAEIAGDEMVEEEDLSEGASDNANN